MYTSSKQEIFDQLSSNNSDFIRTNTDSVIKLCVSNSVPGHSKAKSVKSKYYRAKSVLKSKLEQELNKKIHEELTSSEEAYIKLKKLIGDEISLCDIVEGLKHFLTNTSPTERAFGVQLLVDVLQNLSTTKVNDKELTYLSAFFVDRLKDHHSVVPHVIVGIIALVKQKNITSEDVKSLLCTLFQEVPCQAQILADRRNIYSLLKYCIVNKTKDVKEMNDEFILNFISAAEGEKDPRNLVLLFSFFPNIAKELSLKDFAEDLFELVAAYFPIDFVPPKRDDFIVTTEDLTVGLRACMSSTDSFAPYCIPLLLEKLRLDNIDVKLESLRTLQACCKNYSGLSLRPHVLELWDHLRKEVIEGWNVDVEKEIIGSLSCLVETLERDHSCSDTVNILGSSALSECIPHLSNPEQRLMFPGAEVLLAVCRYSSVLSQTFCEKLIPLLVEQFSQKNQSIAKKNTLIVMSKFLLQGTQFSLFVAEPLLGYRQASFHCLFEGLMSNDKSIKEASILGFKLSLDAFSVGEINRVGGEMAHLITSEELDQNLRNAAIDCLTCIGKKYPSVSTDTLLPCLLGHIEGQTEKRKKLKNILDATSSLCRTTSALKEALPPIWDTILKLVLVGDDLVISFLLCLKNSILLNYDQSECLNYLACDWKAAMKFELLAIVCINSKAFNDPTSVLEEISSLCQMLMPCVKVDEVLKLGEIFYGRRTISETFPEEVVTFIQSSDRLVSFFSQNDLQHSPFMVYCVRCLLVRDDCPLKELRQDIAKHVVKWSLATEGDTRVKEKAASTVALFLLHSPSGEELDAYLCSLKQEISPLLAGDVSAAVRLLGWIVKGLIMRGYPQDREWISMLLNMLTKEGEIGQKASECYKFLLKDDDSLFTLQGIRPKTYKLLYRQRFFESHIGEMVTMFNELGSTRQGLRNNVLLAIFYLFPHLPQAVLKGHLKKLLPILVIGLQGCPSNDAATVAAGAVETLAFLLCHNVEDVTPHVNSLLPSLLKLSMDAPVNVRAKSLECLETLAELPATDLMPYKPEVLQKLKVVLNDRKRVVRRAAAQARSAWVLL